MYCNKRITLTLFISLIITIIFLSAVWIYDNFIEKYIGTYIGKFTEQFNNKRNTKIKIYKSSEIYDPDEKPENNEQDPDNAPMIYDPDQQDNLDDEEVDFRKQVIEKINKYYS
jgi:hypothetical protein